MKLNSKIKRLFALLILIIISISVIAINLPGIVYAGNMATELKFEKITNPTAGEREADGILLGGDREASYAWAMTTRGNYVYVGTNRNVIGSVAQAFVNTLVAGGATEDMAWGIINVATNNDIPRPTKTTGDIFKCDITTGEITKIFTPQGNGVAFRMAIEFDGDVYFASYSADTTATNYIYKIDENDNITVSFASDYGTSMRAACIHDNELYFGGVDSRYSLDTGDEECAKLAIVKKDSKDDPEWDRVADYKDFKEYANDAAVKNSTASPIWDICSYNGYIYATIPNSLGLVMYKGHPAQGNEPANQYGWYWTEVIGKNSEVNNIGLAETAAGQIGDNAGLISACATPFVFKDKLYLMNFDNTIQAEIEALTGLLMTLSGQQVDLSTYLKPMYTTLNNPQKLWVYDDTTGKFNEVEGFKQFMKDTCNEYLWRTEIYNDELYISTMDSAVLYNWVIQFTGSNFTTMTAEELDGAVTKIDNLLGTIGALGNTNTQAAEMIELLEDTKEMIVEYKTVMSDSREFNNFVVEHEDLIAKLEALSENVANMESNALTDLCTKVDWDGLRMYAYIVRMVENDTWGFDLLKTSDGENFKIVTDSGFGDKYNYGGRSLITTDAGLYVGTANPFYGAQLWRVSKETTDTPSNPDQPSNPNNPSDPGNDTGVSKEELDALKEQLNTIISNQQRFEEELRKLSEELAALKNNTNNGSTSGGNTTGENTNGGTSSGGKVDSDDTGAPGILPDTGVMHIIITLVAVVAVGIVVTFKYLQYRNIDKH